MCIPRIVVVLLLGVMLVAALPAEDQASPRPMAPAVLLSIFLGFGSGQYYLGESGVLFTVGDVAGIGLVAGGVAYVLVAWADTAHYTTKLTSYGSESYPETTAGYVMLGGGIVVYAVSRVWQLINVVSYRPRKAEQTSSLTPVIEARPQGVSFAVRWQY
jgi:hypothetical protein